MNGYFIAILVLQAMTLGIALVKHGQPKDGTWSFWTYLFSTLIDLWLIVMTINTGF